MNLSPVTWSFQILAPERPEMVDYYLNFWTLTSHTHTSPSWTDLLQAFSFLPSLCSRSKSLQQ